MVGEARWSSRRCAAMRIDDIAVAPLSSVTKPIVGSAVSVYFIFAGAGYFWSRSHSVRAMPLVRSQVVAKVASPRKRGSPPAANDCPGSQNFASPLMAMPLSARSASAPPCAFTACATRSLGFCASAGCAWLTPSSNAAEINAYFIAIPSLSCGRKRWFLLLCSHPSRPAVGRRQWADHYSVKRGAHCSPAPAGIISRPAKR